jgi:S1-C subfamily serine protease
METFSSEASGALLALSNDLAGAIERAGRVVVGVNARPRVPSSGVHWRQGVIVTADHTIKREEDITVALPDGRSVTATLAGRDASTDLAVLKVPEGACPTAEIGDSSGLKVGHLVVAVARPGERGRSLSASMGVVSAVGGAWRTWSGGQIDQFVRLDLTLYTGFSGGPLVDAQGLIVGVNTSGPRNMVLAVPTSTVNRVVDQLLDKGRIARGYLGLGMQPVRLPDTMRNALKLSGHGAIIIVAVQPDSPAERVGVLIGDVLVALDGKPVSDTSDVLAMLGPERVGGEVRASIIRGGILSERLIPVGERPQRES